ncbi:hypothetical protein OS189_01810 [Sulfitobacter sp. F26169L]|uniref:AAA family ATPase n=1 Tax=Sulfitobacter sp. F26169L TaxID=2996015 RepID=UPI002260893F|nr:hypothetical protein [Sulfitobacter sp. F26169L]MCX7565077.1 hypothetical protein [Sulfitobacter sp. F26169L]
MTHSSSGTVAVDPFAAYVCTDQGAEVARDVGAQLSGDNAAMHGGGLGGAARICTGAPLAQMILTEMGNMSLDAACECVRELAQSGAILVVLGDKPDLATYRALRTAGATEYFAFPASDDEIIAAYTEAAAQRQTSAATASRPDTEIRRTDGLCIAVTGCNGGVGASLLAQSLAYHSASMTGAKLRTALVDADLRFGSQAIDLDRKDTPGLTEALSSPDRVDETFLSATMEPLNERLMLYSQQAHISQDTDELEVAFAQLVRSMKNGFEALVVDLPRAALLRQPHFANELDALVLVIPAGYAGVNVASRMIALLKSQAPDLNILPVLSEFRQDAKLSAKDISKAIGRDLAAVIPDSGAAIRKAHRAAKPLLETQPRSPHAKATRAIWDSAAGAVPRAHPSPKSKRRIFRRATV